MLSVIILRKKQVLIKFLEFCQTFRILFYYFPTVNMGSWYIFCKRKNCIISSSHDRKPVFTNNAHRRHPQKYKADYQGYLSLESWILSYGQTNVYFRNWEFWLHYVREERVKNIQKHLYLQQNTDFNIHNEERYQM